MPLPTPKSPRLPKHTRSIEAQAYEREDGLWDIDARITDTKTRATALASGIRKAGDPIHDLWLRITIDTQLNIVDAQNDSATQANQLATAASGNTKAVIVNPVDSDAAASAVNALIAAGIAVVGVDRTVNGADLASLVASDNVAGGRQAADALATAMGGKGSVIHLQGVSGTSASRDRGAGFEEGMKAYPDITIVAKQTANFDRAAALDVTTNLLQANPDVTGLFAENDEMALGAIQALGAKAGTDISVVGFDGTADGLAAIEAGTLVATIAQQPAELGRLAVELAVKAIKGEKIEKTVPVEVVAVSKANVGDFIK